MLQLYLLSSVEFHTDERTFYLDPFVCIYLTSLFDYRLKVTVAMTVKITGLLCRSTNILDTLL